ncbi:MAG: hypothetical protein LBH92_03065 [Bacteroidales bacterium]|jgi:3-hydroxyacyl-[acyl-carrier-protein] dehydratase|nr:hypothetical protein [Bacteroidales bacterium]
MFKDDFYSITEHSFIEPNIAEFTVRFNLEHIIYHVHFKNNPITPGVLIVQIVKELFSFLKKDDFSIKKVKSIRFVHPLIPTEHSEAQYKLELQTVDNEGLYPVNVTVYSRDIVFSKIKLYLKQGNL